MTSVALPLPYFLRRARRISKPPESRTIADAADAPSISGATVTPANAKLAAPANNKLKPITWCTISPPADFAAYYVYFLRVVRKTSKLPESSAIAEVADAPSISGAVTLAQAKLAAPTSNKVKERSLYIILSSDLF
jgi:hypothetical protein